MIYLALLNTGPAIIMVLFRAFSNSPLRPTSPHSLSLKHLFKSASLFPLSTQSDSLYSLTKQLSISLITPHHHHRPIIQTLSNYSYPNLFVFFPLRNSLIFSFVESYSSVSPFSLLDAHNRFSHSSVPTLDCDVEHFCDIRLPVIGPSDL